jgi:hypothetical protein
VTRTRMVRSRDRDDDHRDVRDILTDDSKRMLRSHPYSSHQSIQPYRPRFFSGSSTARGGRSRSRSRSRSLSRSRARSPNRRRNDSRSRSPRGVRVDLTSSRREPCRHAYSPERTTRPSSVSKSVDGPSFESVTQSYPYLPTSMATSISPSLPPLQFHSSSPSPMASAYSMVDPRWTAPAAIHPLVHQQPLLPDPQSTMPDPQPTMFGPQPTMFGPPTTVKQLSETLAAMQHYLSSCLPAATTDIPYDPLQPGY